jgi:hypothetical protein
MLKLYVLGFTPPHVLESDSPQSIYEKLILTEHHFSSQTGIFPNLTYAFPQLDANLATYGFVEEVSTTTPLHPEEIVESIRKTGQIPSEPEETRPVLNILECLLFRSSGLALVTKRYGRLRNESVRDACTKIRDMIAKKTETIVGYGRGDPRDTWLQQGLKFLDHLVRTHDKEELQVLKIAHKKGTRDIVFQDMTDLIRDSGLAKARETLGLHKQHTVEVKVDWLQTPLTTLELIMKFDYRRGIGFRTNIMDFENVNQRASILKKFVDQYATALGQSWAELLFGELHPLEHYFGMTPEISRNPDMLSGHDLSP